MGRPKKYEEKQLLEKIKSIAKEYPQLKITYSLLARETGIPIHIWRDGTYKKIDSIINKLNSSISTNMLIESANVQISDMLNEICCAEGNEKKIKDIAFKHRELEQEMLKMLVDLKKQIDCITNNNELLKKELDEYKQRCALLEKELSTCYAGATNIVARKSMGVKPIEEIVGPINTKIPLLDEEFKKEFGKYLK